MLIINIIKKTGVYKIQLNNMVYIGSTIRGFRERFNKHINANTMMPHTKKLLDDGGAFEILWIANNNESESYIRHKEQFYIDYYIKNGYDIINEDLHVKIKGEHKYICSNMKRILVDPYKFKQAVELLNIHGISTY